MTTTLFTNAHIATGEPGSTAASTLPLQDILVTDGVFTAFGPGLAQQYEAQGGDLAAIEVVDLGGKLVCHRSAIRICTLITYSRPASPVR